MKNASATSSLSRFGNCKVTLLNFEENISLMRFFALIIIFAINSKEFFFAASGCVISLWGSFSHKSSCNTYSPSFPQTIDRNA